MSDQNKKPNPLVRVWRCMGVIAGRFADWQGFSAERLTAIEDRLALLDGGDNAKAARRGALVNANARRISAGRAPLSMKVDDTTGNVVWTDQ